MYARRAIVVGCGGRARGADSVVRRKETRARANGRRRWMRRAISRPTGHGGGRVLGGRGCRWCERVVESWATMAKLVVGVGDGRRRVERSWRTAMQVGCKRGREGERASARGSLAAQAHYYRYRNCEAVGEEQQAVEFGANLCHGIGASGASSLAGTLFPLTVCSY